MSLFFDSENGLYMYEYNIDNIRTKKTVYEEDVVTIIYESEYILNGTSIIQEKRTYGDGSVVILDFLYDDSGVILGVVYNGTTYYYRKNLQGDITGVVNSSGTVVVSYTYDAWGNPVSITGSMSSTLGEINPIRYRGYYYDTETGFYYLQSRYYDPVVGRFISPDDTAFLGVTGTTLSLNLFAYCENNAVNRKDDTGCIFIPTIPTILGGAIIGGILSALLEACVQIFWDGKSLSSLDWKSIGIEFLNGALTGALIACNLPTKTTALGRGIINMFSSLAHSLKKEKFKTINGALGAIGEAIASGAITIIAGILSTKIGKAVNNKNVKEIIKNISINRITRGGIRLSFKIGWYKFEKYFG